MVKMNQYNFLCLIFIYFLYALIDLGFEFAFRYLKISFTWQNCYSSFDFVFKNMLYKVFLLDENFFNNQKALKISKITTQPPSCDIYIYQPYLCSTNLHVW